MTGLRIVVDATPLLGPRTGIGQYAANLLTELPAALRPDDEVVATAFTLRGHRELAAVLPDGIVAAARPVPARLLRAAWLHADVPRVEMLAGHCDVVHGTNFMLPPARVPGVVTIHDLAFLRRPETVARASLDYVGLVARALARGAIVATPSHAVADQILDAYALSPDRVVVTPNGVDSQWSLARPPDARLRSELGLPTDYLVAVGTVEPRKNLALLVQVLRLAADRGVDLPPLVLVGASGWGDELDTSAVPEGRIVRTGHLGIDHLRAVVAGSSGLLFPSLDEGFGLPPLEAMAAGVPVVAADLPVTREVLGDEAAYRSPTDAEGWLDAVGDLATSPVGTPESRRLRAGAFTWAATAKATVTAYRRALSS